MNAGLKRCALMSSVSAFSRPVTGPSPPCKTSRQPMRSEHP
jgi:hypothetical protein